MFKKIIIVVMFVMLSMNLFAELNGIAKILKNDIPVTYANIKKNAIKKWGNDQQMIVHEINTQATSFASIVTFLNAVNDTTNATLRANTMTIIADAFVKWSNENAEETLTKLKSDFGNIDIDWQMVEYEIETQLKAYGEY